MSLLIAKNKITLAELREVPTPPETESFLPIPHALLVDLTREAVERAGLTIIEEEYATARGGLRFFGAFALTGENMQSEERRIVLGLRNSHDKAFAAAICIGNKMLVCENLCFSSDIKLARRHTVNILKDLPRVIADAVGRCLSHWNDMEKRIEAYKSVKLTREQANDLVISLTDAQALPARDIYNVITEFRKPQFEEFAGETLWSLYNAVTFCLKGGDLNKLPSRTMAMQSIFDRLARHTPALEVQEIVTRGCEDNAPPEGANLTSDDDDFEPLVVDEA